MYDTVGLHYTYLLCDCSLKLESLKSNEINSMNDSLFSNICHFKTPGFE